MFCGLLRKPELFHTLVCMILLHALWLQLISDGPFSVGLVDFFWLARHMILTFKRNED
jgi:hypothetical protein